ncbi:centrosomal protein of 97 kDa isoform X3 [Eurosta solidaginis]|uniref:centrosomal protein of 97 kDa isoform X3 n=1 Tax=Eurosta solidaginis TaxID=178769 RepID=UPI003531573A
MSEEDNDKITLDLSKKQLKKVPKQEDAQNVRVLKLDENELQKIDNIDSYLKIEVLSLSKNQLLRMYGVCRLHCLRELNLSFNGILSIEGLKDCIHLRHLNLEGNNIKTIEHLNNNIKLEYLNLAENSIGSISDISFLKNLKELYLHGNRLTHLRQCDKYLPVSLEILSLAKNNISDLNEICTLLNLTNLHSLTLSENPCIMLTGNADGFDHRPFVLNWCMSLKVIDGFVVDPIESLKAEWLYSQGRGRQFRIGEQAALAKYLSSVCPLIGKALENENERKLRLILSKAQQHQRQLQEEITENSNASSNNSPSSGRRKTSSRIQSPRFSRLSGRQGSPESMVNSYHGNTTSETTPNSVNNHAAPMTTSLIENIKHDAMLMSQSFEGSSTSGCSNINTRSNNSQESTPRTITPNPYNDQNYANMPTNVVGPLAAASKMVPVPETLMSPDVCPAVVAQRVTVNAINTQLQNSKTHKNKDNKLNSPKMRSPHLTKRNTIERCSPNMSPRRGSSTSNMLLQHNNVSSISRAVAVHAQSQVDNQMKSRLASSSIHIATPETGSAGALSSDDDSDHINIDKLKTIRNKAAQRSQQQQKEVAAMVAASNAQFNQNNATESSAVVIQKIWRGYRTRKKTKDIAEKLLKIRTHEYIDFVFSSKLTKDMELTKAQLENERKIQQLQMQAINALWKKVSTMQGCSTTAGSAAQASSDGASNTVEGQVKSAAATTMIDSSSTAAVHDLAKTCTMLTSQVQQLQGSMRDILNCLTLFCNLPQENVKQLLSAGVADALSNEKRDCAATQTEIIAVHTPQIENQSNFPFSKIRPSSLPLDKQKSQHKQLVGGTTAITAATGGSEIIRNETTTQQQQTQHQRFQHEQIAEDCDRDEESGIQSEDVQSMVDAGFLFLFIRFLFLFITFYYFNLNPNGMKVDLYIKWWRKNLSLSDNAA